MRKLDIRGNPTVYGASIRVAEEAEGWSISLTALASMGQEIKRNVISENAAISSCMRSSHWTECLACLKDMQTCHTRSPTSVSYAAAMAAVSSTSWRAPLGLLTHLRTLRAVDAIGTSTAVRACCGHAAWAIAMDVVMHSSSINEVSFHIILESFSGTCNWEQAIELLCCMRAARIRISAAPCAAAMRGCGLGGQWQMVLGLLDELLSLKTLLDETTLSCAMDASARSGNWELALHLFCEEGSGRELCDPVTYTAAIAACLRGSHWQLALELVSDFENLKLVPDTILFNAGISAAQTGTQWEAALSELQRMQTFAVRADSVSHNTAVSGCERVSLWQRACDVLRKIQQRLLRFSEVGHNAVTSSLEKSTKWPHVLLCFEEQLHTQGTSLPSQIAIDTTATAIQKSSHWHLAIEQIARRGTVLFDFSLRKAVPNSHSDIQDSRSSLHGLSRAWHCQDFPLSPFTRCALLQCCHQRVREELSLESGSGASHRDHDRCWKSRTAAKVGRAQRCLRCSVPVGPRTERSVLEDGQAQPGGRE